MQLLPTAQLHSMQYIQTLQRCHSYRHFNFNVYNSRLHISYHVKCGLNKVIARAVNFLCTNDIGEVTISDPLRFRQNSVYDGDSVQFTLTCISNGGPATNVNWTRNSEAVTDGTGTVLNDSVDAVYTHTLTVTGRLGGLYQCTVSNNKPSSDSLGIFIQGDNNNFCMYIV